MRIMIDLDGVVADFNKAAISKFGPGDETLYDLRARWPDRAAEVAQFVRAPETYRTLPLIPGATWGWQALHHAGHEIVVCTSRPDNCQGVTREWLAGHGLHYQEMIFVPWTAHKLKGEVLAGRGIHMAVEDAVDQAASIQAAGIPVLMMKAPWNVQHCASYMVAGDWLQVVCQALWFARFVAHDPYVHEEFARRFATKAA